MLTNNNGSLKFGGWGMPKATQRGARLLQDLNTLGRPIDTEKELKLNTPANKPVQSTKQSTFDTELNKVREYVQKIVRSKQFTNLMLLVIMANCITIAIDTSISHSHSGYSVYADLVFLSIYMVEFILNVFVSAKAYWAIGYNRFDVVILLISTIQFFLSLYGAGIGNLTFLRVFRSLRALRSLRSISSVRRLQIIVKALLGTLRKSVLDIVACLFAFTFIFAIMGYYLFGVDSQNVSEDFHTLGMSLLSLLYYITSSGWTDVQTNLTQKGYIGSEFYSIIFMVISNFIFSNMFVGVICENIEEASDAERANQLRIRLEAQKEKKDAFREKQKNDMRDLLARTDFSSNQNMQKILESLAGTLRHDEIVPMTHLACNLTWFEAFMVTQYHLENSMYQCQQTHFKIANTLTEMLDRRVKLKAARGL